MGILIPKPFSKFSKLKNQTQKNKKRPPKVPKKKCYKEQENRKVGILIPKPFSEQE